MALFCQLCPAERATGQSLYIIRGEWQYWTNWKPRLEQAHSSWSSVGLSTTLSTTLSTINKYSTLFLLGLKEERKLTQTALQGIVEGATTLSQSRLSASTLNIAGMSQSSISALNELFDSDGPFGRPFSGLETQHQQLTFYKTLFQFIVRYSFMLIYSITCTLVFSLWVFFLSGTSECTSWWAKSLEKNAQPNLCILFFDPKGLQISISS